MNIFEKVGSWFTDTPPGLIKKPLSKPIEIIPPCSVMCFRGNDGMLATDIRISEKDREGGNAWSNHTVYCAGGHLTYESVAKGFVPTTIEDSMESNSQFKIYTKMNLTAAEVLTIQAKAKSLRGTKYDFLGLLSFWVPSIFKPSNNRGWCSEEVEECFWPGIKISGKPANESSPDDVETYLESGAAKNEFWVLWDTYNC